MLRFALTSHNVEQTHQLGARIGQALTAGDIVCLSGTLGAGKTALVAGIGSGWGALEPINSPTFVIVHEHRRNRDTVRLYHLDCYRLNSAADAESIGLDDMLTGSDVVVIEWPERIAEWLPVERLTIHLTAHQGVDPAAENIRQITLDAVGSRYETLLDELQHHVG